MQDYGIEIVPWGLLKFVFIDGRFFGYYARLLSDSKILNDVKEYMDERNDQNQ